MTWTQFANVAAVFRARACTAQICCRPACSASLDAAYCFQSASAFAPPAFLHAGGAAKASQICATPMSTDDDPATLSEITDSLIHDYDALVARAYLGAAREKQKTIVDDMGYLRDQITTTEVNMARVFNWDVKERRKQKAAAEKS